MDVAVDSAVAPGELARFQLLVDGTPLMPLSCPSDDWEFPTPQGQGMASPQCMPLVTSASITNSGTVPFAYIAQGLWNLGVHYVPGVATGDSCQLVGVLAPGESIDITSVYQGGTVAVLGSAAPFSSADAGKTISDEGTIPWPAGVQGSGGATTMYLAQIDVPLGSSCTAVPTFF